MKFIKQVRRYAAPSAVAGSVMAVAAAPAFADSAEAAAAVKAALTDVNVIGWAVVGVLAGIMVFRLIKRVL